MKKMVMGLLLQIAVCTPLSAQWEVLNEGQPSFVQIDFVSDDVGWGLSNGNFYPTNNLLKKTNDFGRSWTEIDISGLDNMNVFEIDFVSDSMGWVLAGNYGEASRLYYTDNGGDSWKMLYESLRLENICVTQENIVFVVTNHEILKITNNEVFEILPNIAISGHIVGMWFKDSNMGFVTDSGGHENGDNYLYATTDGGNTWTKSSIPFLGMRNLQFVGDSLIYFIPAYLRNGLYKSIDNLQTWSLVSQMEFGIDNYHIISQDTIYLITPDDIRLSVDAGATAEVVKGLSPGISDPWGGWTDAIVNFNSRNEGFITTGTCLVGVSEGACITGRMDFRTEDKGRSWILSELSYPFNEVSFVNEKRGYAVGGGGGGVGFQGDIFVTNDGGSSWELSRRSYSRLSSVQFFDETTGYVSNDGFRVGYPIILKTNDGGNIWEEIHIDGLNNIGSVGQSMYFTDENTGWFVDNGNHRTTIWETKDGGQNWTNSWESVIDSYSRRMSMHFSESVGWIVGSDGRTIKYENGRWQEIASPANKPLDKVFFYDAEYGWITSEYDNEYQSEPTLFRTEDGGATWESVHMDFKINDLFFEDRKTGWAVGEDTTDNRPAWGIILHTVDGGSTWTLAKDEISGELTDIYFKDGYLWAVGNNGLVLKTMNKTTGVETVTSDRTPDTFSLSQNYPNPFNPETSIEFSLHTAEHVRIEVYDALGRTVQTLADEKLMPGKYSVTFNASQLPTGVYVASMEAGDFKDTKKMLLIR